MSAIDHESGQKKYETVRKLLRTHIREQLHPHDPLPTERELMAQFGVSRITIREALAGLVDEGIVYRIQGSGTFVADPASITKSLSLTSFSEDIRARRMTPGSRLILSEQTEATMEIASDLSISPGAPVYHLERVRTADGEPMCLENVWLPADMFDSWDDSGDSLYERLEELGAGPRKAEQSIRATVLDKRQAGLLDVAPHSAALLVTRITFDARGRKIERARSVYRADRYDFQVTVTRRSG